MNSKKLLLLLMLCFYGLVHACECEYQLLPTSDGIVQKREILEIIKTAKWHRSLHKWLSHGSYILWKLGLIEYFFLDPLLAEGLPSQIVNTLGNVCFSGSILIWFYGTYTRIKKYRAKKQAQNLIKMAFTQAQMDNAIWAIDEGYSVAAREALGLKPGEGKYFNAYSKQLYAARRSSRESHQPHLGRLIMPSDIETGSAKLEVSTAIQGCKDRDDRFRALIGPLSYASLLTCFALSFYANRYLEVFQNHHPNTDWPLIALKGLYITEGVLFVGGIAPLVYRFYEKVDNYRKMRRVKCLIKGTFNSEEIDRAIVAIEENKCNDARKMLDLAPEQSVCLPEYKHLLCEAQKEFNRSRYPLLK